MLLNCSIGDSWTARKSNQSILKETSPEYSLEGLVLKLKLQYLGHLMRTTEIIRKYPEAGKDWRRKEKGTTEDEMVGWHHRLNEHEFEWAPGHEGQEKPDPMWTRGLQYTRLPVLHHLLDHTQTHVHWVGDATQPSHPLSSPSPSAFNLSQHQSFLMSQLFASGGQSTGASVSASVLLMNIQN